MNIEANMIDTAELATRKSTYHIHMSNLILHAAKRVNLPQPPHSAHASARLPLRYLGYQARKAT